MDDLVAAHPELDEKSLRRGYAQAKSAAKKTTTTGTKGKKKAAKKVARPRVKPAAESVAAAPVVRNPSSDPDIRKFVLQHGLKAVKAAIAELDS